VASGAERCVAEAPLSAAATAIVAASATTNVKAAMAAPLAAGVRRQRAVIRSRRVGLVCRLGARWMSSTDGASQIPSVPLLMGARMALSSATRRRSGMTGAMWPSGSWSRGGVMVPPVVASIGSV
jgi:hypothetical protein